MIQGVEDRGEVEGMVVVVRGGGGLWHYPTQRQP